MRCVRDEKGEVLVMDDEILNRWRRYFEALMNEGAETVEQEEESREGVSGVELVSAGEVDRALRKMKAGKAVGPDGIPVKVRKIVGGKATIWLQGLFNRMLRGEQMPREWRGSG